MRRLVLVDGESRRDDILAKEAVRSREALEALYERYLPRVYSFALRRTGDVSDAEDIASSVFEKVIANLDKFDERKAAFSTWIFRITLNAINDHYRALKRRRECSLESWDEGKPAEKKDPGDSSELRIEVLGLLERLPGKYREALSLRYFANMRVAEVAEVLGISETAASKRILRGLERLRKLMVETGTQQLPGEVCKPSLR